MPTRRPLLLLLLLLLTTIPAPLARAAAGPGTGTNPLDTPVGGINAAEPAPPPKLAIGTTDLILTDTFALRIPTGTYTAPEGGAAPYSVPGPIVAFRGPDGTWRGHGYLETYPRLLSFTGTVEGTTATFDYRFENDGRYQVTLTAADDKRSVTLTEQSNLGPRNLFVFDCFYHWQPSSGFVANHGGRQVNHLYLPCHYDKPEATVVPQAEPAATDPTILAVVSGDPTSRDVAGFFCRDLPAWQGAATMGLQLWQRRQRPGDPGSRHFQGPETKSDSTPNPATGAMIGRSLYEGHATIELSLGTGSRVLGFAVTAKGDTRPDLAAPFLAIAGNQP